MSKPKRSCLTGKTCFPTRGSAEATRRRLGGTGRTYRCECGWYHLSSKTHGGGQTARHGRRKARQRAWRGS